MADKNYLRIEEITNDNISFNNCTRNYIVQYKDTYVVKLAKPLDVDYIKAIVEFPVNDDDFVVSLRSSTKVKCTNGFTLSEHIAVPDTTQLGYILKSGVKEARTALNKHNQ